MNRFKVSSVAVVSTISLVAFSCSDDPAKGGVDAGGEADAVAASLDAPATIQVGVSYELAVEPASEVDWSLQSATAEFDCTDLLTTDGATAALRLPGTVDARCADELELTVRADATVITHAIEVVPTEGRVTEWTPFENNPAVPMLGCPAWHCFNHSDPTLGQLPDGRLAVWAAASGVYREDTYQNFPVVGRWVQDGDSWVPDEEPSLDPLDVGDGGWARARETPSVRWNADAERWDMWFLGYSVSFFEDPGIGQLQSEDPEGTQWGWSSEPIYRPTEGGWDESFLTSPSALRGSDGVWRLYFSGGSFAVEGGSLKIGVLTSEDGQTWTAYDQNPVFEGPSGEWDEGILDPHVQFVGGRYVMWYSGYTPPLDVESDDPIAVGVAVSEDGYSWTRITEEPVLAPVPNSWTDKRVLDVEVLPQEDGSLLMTGYGTSTTVAHPFNPDLYPGRIGFWRSP